jgi:ATP-dependent DNA helicase RecG
MSLETDPVTVLHGVGDALAAKLARLGILTVQDLLFHLPARYEDRTFVRKIGELRLGERVQIEAEVQLAEVAIRRRRSLLVRVSDGTGSMTLRFFYFNRSQQAQLKRGQRIRCFGEMRRGGKGLEMIHPEYRLLSSTDNDVEETLTPIYPITEGVQQGRMRSLVNRALDLMDQGAVADLLPESVDLDAESPTLPEALKTVHHPPPDAPVALLLEGRHPAQRRLAYEELLAQHLALRRVRTRVRSNSARPIEPGDLAVRFTRSLPFALTGAQSRVLAELAGDLARPVPMTRLLQGDVGAGKTVVAAAALFAAVDAGSQGVLMAPTELLAEQHMRNLSSWCEPLGVRVVFLSGRTKGRQRSASLAEIASGQAQLVVGTHALFQAEIEFRDLGLVVVDEQHRFGVDQRLALLEKGRDGERLPHQLIMTATPIPRTLAMTVYADLDISVIDELPPNRKPIATVAVSEDRRPEVVQRVRAACGEGRQAYWVCALVEASDEIAAQAAEEVAAELSEALQGLQVGLVHGRMKASEKAEVMQRFQRNQLHVLVATTVIEVGVDVANASLMVIENSERMGLAQLHQLRGRVGRGDMASSCVLLWSAPMSDIARERLSVMRESQDGFRIAQRDLELRGPGEVLGTRQTGVLQLRIADLARDADLLPRVQAAALALEEAHAGVIGALIRRWVGDASGEYGRV